MGRGSLVAVAAAAMTGSVSAFVGAPASVLHLKPSLAVCAVDRPGLALRAWGGTRKDATAEPDADADARGAYDVDKQYDADINGYANPMATGACAICRACPNLACPVQQTLVGSHAGRDVQRGMDILCRRIRRGRLAR